MTTRPSGTRAYHLLGVSFLLATLSVPLDAQQGAPPFEVYEASITELQQAMVEGRVTSVQLVDAYLARIDAYDRNGPELNSVIRLNPAAGAEAARLDAERAAGRVRGPLHGIPVLLKDNYDTADMPTSAASIALAGHRPLEDAHQVTLLREAGAVILGKTNLHELAYGITTISSLGGQTRNPYDPRRNPGGSSGGTGAAVAASLAAVGWGSDTCGSIRIPSAVNNLFGLRPTKGLSSIAGIVPLSHSQDTGGPLARSITDLAIALDATVGPDPNDPATAALSARTLPSFVESLDSDALRGARIGVLRQYFGTLSEERETTRVVEEALEELKRLGAEVFDVEFPDMEEVLTGTSLIDFEFKWDLADYLARTPDAPVSSLTEIVEGGLYHQAVAGVLTRSDRHQSRQVPGLDEALARRAAALAALEAVFDAHDLDALAYPSLRRDVALIGEPSPGSNCQLSAATGTPALTVPAGFTDRGLPAGLELLGRRFDDHRLVAMGFAYEQAVAPRKPPHTTPPLVNGGAPRPATIEVSVQPLEGGLPWREAQATFRYDRFTRSVDYELAFDGVPELHGVVLRVAPDGPIVHRLSGADIEQASGAVTLSASEAAALEGDGLLLQVFAGRGPRPAGEVMLALPR